MLYFAKSDIGMKRTVNQDSYNTRTVGDANGGAFIAVVCDGMGGSAGGGIASSVAIDIFTNEAANALSALPGIADGENTPAVEYEVIVPRIIRSACEKANSFLYKVSKRDTLLDGMGTTLVCAVIIKDRVFVGNVGDSRLYLISKQGISQITHDHSLVQYLVDQGRMTDEEAKSNKNKNIIIRAIGVGDEVDCDVFRFSHDISQDEYILLCTDGLTNSIEDDEIMDIVLDRTLPSAREKTEYLIDRANISGGNDNITALLIKLDASESHED